MSDFHLHFNGPYTFTDEGESVFRCQHAKTGGIYLWTVRQEDGAHLIHYIGETAWLGWRHREHLVQILGLNYGIYDISDAREGKLTPLWKGLWRDRTADGPGKVLAEYPGGGWLQGGRWCGK